MMDLSDWVTGELQSLRQRLAGGVLEQIPPERHSEYVDGGGVPVTYVLWHLARHHDVAVNRLLRGRPEVVGEWTDRLGVSTDLWRGLAEGEDQDLVADLDPVTVSDYTLAVIDESIGWTRTADLTTIDHVPDSGAALADLGAPENSFDWLYSMWAGKPGSLSVRMP